MLLNHLLLPPLCVLFLQFAHLLELVDSCIVLQLFSVPFVLVALVIGLDELERLAVGVTRSTCTHKRIVVRVELGLQDLILSNGLVALVVDRLIASRGFLQSVLQVDGLLLNLVLFQKQLELGLF